MTNNLYEDHPLMIDSGTFWRCRHGKTGAYKPCWKCGLFHPIRLLQDYWSYIKYGPIG